MHWRTEVWSETRWLSERSTHTDLVRASQVDPLFLSWEWLTTWWKIFGARKRRKLHCLAVYHEDSLAALAPFYTTIDMRAGIIPVRSLQLVGLGWRDTESQISEYLDVLVMEKWRNEGVSLIATSLESLKWNEIALGFTDSNAAFRHIIERLCDGEVGHLREIEPNTSHQANLSAGFETYLKALGASTRRSLWAMRRRLEKARFEIVDSTEADKFFSDLNHLHSLRWGEPVFSGARLEFHELLSRVSTEADSDIEMIFSRLWSGSKIISMLYDIRVGTIQYNIQLGFDPTYNTHISPGLLHLGYAMEHAAAHHVRSYDFLAGPGQKTNYKRNLAQQIRTLTSIQYVRGSYLAPLYRWHDRQRDTGEPN